MSKHAQELANAMDRLAACGPVRHADVLDAAVFLLQRRGYTLADATDRAREALGREGDKDGWPGQEWPLRLYEVAQGRGRTRITGEWGVADLCPENPAPSPTAEISKADPVQEGHPENG